MIPWLVSKGLTFVTVSNAQKDVQALCVDQTFRVHVHCNGRRPCLQVGAGPRPEHHRQASQASGAFGRSRASYFQECNCSCLFCCFVAGVCDILHRYMSCTQGTFQAGMFRIRCDAARLHTSALAQNGFAQNHFAGISLLLYAPSWVIEPHYSACK